MRFPSSHPLQPHRPMASVPPGGFAGVAQQTPATLATMSTGVPSARYAMAANGRSAPPRRRRRKAKRAAPRRARRSGAKRRASRRNRRARLVKGSAAAKRHMARLRAKRRKR